MELKSTSGNAKSTDKRNSKSNNKLVEQQQVKGTPFTAIKYNDEWFLTLGKYRLTESKKTLSEVIKDAKRADWYRVMQIMNIVLDEKIETLKNNLNK